MRYRLTWTRKFDRDSEECIEIWHFREKFEFVTSSNEARDAIVLDYISDLERPEECSGFELVRIRAEEKTSPVEMPSVSSDPA